MIIDNQQLILKRKVQRLSLVRGVQYKRQVLEVVSPKSLKQDMDKIQSVLVRDNKKFMRELHKQQRTYVNDASRCCGVLKTLKIFKKYYFLIDKMQDIQYNISDEKEVISMYLTLKQQVKHLSKKEFRNLKYLCHIAKNLISCNFHYF